MNDRGLPLYDSVRQLLRRYDRRSLAALGALVSVQLTVGIAFRGHVAANAWMWRDPILIGTWIVMTALMTWDVRPRRDGMLVVVGFLGGLVIEWWGTTTLLWTYFTTERPPIWILPAWPVAALAIDRLARILTLLRPILVKPAAIYAVLFSGFIVWMTLFMGPAIRVPSSWVIAAIMLATLLWKPVPDRDVCIFLAGTALGIFLEYWGTSRRCWIYYTNETPPPVATLAHGFASVTFSRGVQLLELAVARFSTRPPAGTGYTSGEGASP